MPLCNEPTTYELQVRNPTSSATTLPPDFHLVIDFFIKIIKRWRNLSSMIFLPCQYDM